MLEAFVAWVSGLNRWARRQMYIDEMNRRGEEA